MDHDEIEEIALRSFRGGVYSKNIEYSFSPNADLRELKMLQQMAGAPGLSAWIIQQAYRKIGSQLHVQKEVSDDLRASDLPQSVRLQDIVWPSRCVEMYFEDPLLPTVLLMKIYPAELGKLFPGMSVNLPAEEYTTALIQEGNGLRGRFLSLQIRPEQYQLFMDEARVNTMRDKGTGLFTHELNEQDHASLCYLLHLCMRVFAFASIPHMRPAPITRKQMHYGGKPDVRGRPNRPAFRALYLPNIKYQFAGENERGGSGEGDGTHRSFRGRRGHFRFFRSDYFVNKKGGWTLIRPVPAKDGTYPTRKMYVRKPGA